MFKMKKIKVFNVISVLMILILALSLNSCGQKEKEMKVTDYTDKQLNKWVKLGKYKGVEVEKPSIEVTDEDIDMEINGILNSYAVKDDVMEGIAEEGDRVKITYVGKLNGIPFEGGSTGDEPAVITLGNSGYIPGFDKGVIGMGVGDTKVLNLQFPSNYWKEDLAGKKVTFDVTLVAKVLNKLPEFNDEFVQEHSDKKTVAEYRTMLKEEIKKNKEDLQQSEIKQLAWEKVVENSEVKEYPDELLKRVKDEIKDMHKKTAEQYDLSLDDWLENNMGMTKEDYNSFLDEYSKSVIDQELVVYAIAKKEKIKILQKEYDQQVKDLKEESGVTDEAKFKEEFGKSFEEYVGKDQILRMMLMEKVIDFVVEKADVK